MSELHKIGKVFEHIHFRIISKPTDELAILKSLLSSQVPSQIDPQEYAFAESSFENSDEQTQHILELDITKTRHLNLYTKWLSEVLNPQLKEIVLAQLDTRIDDECNLFIRFDLDELMQNQYVLTQSGRCLHCRFTIAAFPKRKEVAVSLVEKYLKQDL
jgi:RNA binding exosome subunit